MNTQTTKLSVHSNITDNEIVIYVTINKSARKAELKYDEASKLLENLKVALASLQPLIAERK